jgi:1,4-dihydroxy-2-naphthoyl-CoA hydrolase
MKGVCSTLAAAGTGPWPRRRCNDAGARQHRAAARAGTVTVTATPIHLGGTVTTHGVVLTDDAGQRLCTLRITNRLLNLKD